MTMIMMATMKAKTTMTGDHSLKGSGCARMMVMVMMMLIVRERRSRRG